MAKGFKLQSVLNYRQSLEDQAQQVLATSLSQRRGVLLRLEEQQQELQQQDQRLCQRQQEGMTVGEMELYETRIYYCRQRSTELKRQLQQLDDRIQKQRSDLLQASRDRQVLDKLKEKQEAEQRAELARRERSELDEISLRGKGRNS